MAQINRSPAQARIARGIAIRRKVSKQRQGAAIIAKQKEDWTIMQETSDAFDVAAEIAAERTIHDLASADAATSRRRILNKLGEDTVHYDMIVDPAFDETCAKYANTIILGVNTVVINQNMCGHEPPRSIDTARMDTNGSVSVLDVLRLAWAATVLSFDATYQIDELWWETPVDTLAAAKAAMADLRGRTTPNTMAYGSCDKVIGYLELKYDAANRTLTIDPGVEG
jgi:hypothetical protein